MAKVGAQRAAELTGRSKSTIQRAMNNGKLSYEVDANGRRVIDVSELERGFGLSQNGGSDAGASVEQELEKASAMLETERLKMRIRMLEEQLEMANDQISDLKDQRDQWQKQASQILITSQFSQKQAEAAQAELKAREQKARERRAEMEKRMEKNVQKLTPRNENKTAADAETDENFNFKGLWKRVKGAGA